MSAPNTNIERQVHRHRGPLTGIALVLAAAVLGFIIWLALVVAGGEASNERAVVDEEQVAPGVVVEERAAVVADHAAGLKAALRRRTGPTAPDPFPPRWAARRRYGKGVRSRSRRRQDGPGGSAG